jgi:hypothetical protein
MINFYNAVVDFLNMILPTSNGFDNLNEVLAYIITWLIVWEFLLSPLFSIIKKVKSKVGL